MSEEELEEQIVEQIKVLTGVRWHSKAIDQSKFYW